MPIVFLSFFVVYLTALFPFAYFRHDDWMMIGNGRIGFADWHNYFESTIRFAGRQDIWFFRPFFKWVSFAAFRLFGLNYYLWLTAQMIVLLAGLYLAARVIEGLTGDRLRAWSFAALFCASWQLHAGSLLWMGEGMMNCPQIFALSLALWCFWRHAVTGRIGFLAGAIGAFGFSLLIKESSVFLVALLGAMVWCEKPWSEWPRKSQAGVLAPFAAVAGAYLVFRLGFVPLNTSYAPRLDGEIWARSIGLLAGPMLVAIVAWLMVGGGPGAGELRRRWPYLPFLGVSCLPYLGHEFFSPGWLLFPGFFLLFCLSLVPRKTVRTSAWLTVGLSVATLSLVFVRLSQMDWWRWGEAQRGFVEAVRTLDKDAFQSIQLELCLNAAYPEVTSERVFGAVSHLEFVVELLGKAPTKMTFVGCGMNRNPASDALRLRWKHPQLTYLP